jgi:hypothetical protein
MNLRDLTNSQELAILEKDHPDIFALLQVYPPEFAPLLLNNKEKLAGISKNLELATASVSVNTMLMKCTENCIYKEICVLFKNEIAPIGAACPIEKKVVLEMECDIIKTLDIDRNNPIEMELLWDLIDAKLLDMRSSGALKDGLLTQTVEQKLGQQSVVTRQELSPNIEAKIELKKLKHSIIDAFVASRRAKKKYGMQNDSKSVEQMIREAASNVEED